MRLMGEFSVRTGKDRHGEVSYIQVPVRYGDINRMAAHIMKNQSENMINTVPFISCYVTDMTISPERRQTPTHVDKVQVYEKKYDYATGKYLDGEVGNTYTVERYMPVPYDLTVQVDIWTSNTDQKLQLLEQILVLFNPSINLQINDNPFDWTGLTYTELVNLVWSVRQIPSGTDDIIDVAALNFTIPIFINPPAKVKRQTLIHTVLNQIKKMQENDSLDWVPNDPIPNKQWVITGFENLKLQVKIEGDSALLLDKDGTALFEDGTPLTWEKALKPYGEFRPGISQLRVRRGIDPTDTSVDIVAVMTEISPIQGNKVLLSIDEDTLPSTTQSSVNAIIDPTKSAPGRGLPDPVTGQRYLILADTPDIPAWTGVAAKANDIILYNGTTWTISFSASGNSSAFVLNSMTNLIYEWRSGQWISAYEGTYRSGWWRLYL
jgi:hypothetical protein